MYIVGLLFKNTTILFRYFYLEKAYKYSKAQVSIYWFLGMLQQVINYSCRNYRYKYDTVLVMVHKGSISYPRNKIKKSCNFGQFDIINFEMYFLAITVNNYLVISIYSEPSSYGKLFRPYTRLKPSMFIPVELFLVITWL